VFTAIATPVFYLNRPGTIRRIFWCWLFPVAVVTFVWDGVVSSLREWTASEWRAAAPSSLAINEGIFVQKISWSQT